MFFAFRRRRNAQTRFSRTPSEATVVSLVRMVQVDPLVQVDPTLAYAKKYAHRSSCVLNTEQSRGFKCGICLGRRRHAPFAHSARLSAAFARVPNPRSLCLSRDPE